MATVDMTKAGMSALDWLGGQGVVRLSSQTQLPRQGWAGGGASPGWAGPRCACSWGTREQSVPFRWDEVMCSSD